MTGTHTLYGKPAIVILFVFLVSALTAARADTLDTVFADTPEHVVLLVVDGLSYKVWDRMELPTLRRMIAAGTLVEKAYLPPAAHPHRGEYAEIHTCSIPNPIMMSGTVFIDRSTAYLQESFFPDRTTAFVANTLSYQSLNTSYHYASQKNGSDADAIDRAVLFMETDPPAFMRVHLQRSGGAGSQSLWTDDDVGWRFDIWAAGSPYRGSITAVDSLIGVFSGELDRMGLLEKTALVILGDHGQNDSGWHPPQFTDSSITTVVLWGAGIESGVRVPYAELIDIVPTICMLMDVEVPETCIGRPIVEAVAGHEGPLPPRQYHIRTMLDQFAEYRTKLTGAKSLVESVDSGIRARYFTLLDRRIEQDFFDITKFTEWTRFRSLEELLDHNGEVLNRLDGLLAELRPDD